MKRSISYFIISIIIFAAFGGCTACGNTSDNERITYSVVFNAEQGGRIEGNTHQTINAGESTQKVIAIADIGYYFVGWSDGVKEPTRHDIFIENKTITAIFEAITNVYK